jgi:hypothetical protein
MSIPSLPATLTPALSDREAVADAIYRAVVAFDTDDLNLLKSSVTSDIVFDLNGTIMDGFDAMHTQCFASVSKMGTTHLTSNLRVNVPDGASKAEVTCSVVAQHYRGGEGMKPGAVPLLAGSLYWVELSKMPETDCGRLSIGRSKRLGDKATGEFSANRLGTRSMRVGVAEDLSRSAYRADWSRRRKEKRVAIQITSRMATPFCV